MSSMHTNRSFQRIFDAAPLMLGAKATYAGVAVPLASMEIVVGGDNFEQNGRDMRNYVRTRSVRMYGPALGARAAIYRRAIIK